MKSAPFEFKPLTVRAAMDKAVIALGSFDGLHLGHKAIIDTAYDLAEQLNASLCVFSFATPPVSHANPHRRILLSDKSERLYRFGAMGADLAIFADFSEIKDMSPEDFIEKMLIGRFNAIATVCGFNFCFGKDRSGTPEVLKRYFGENAVCVDAVMHGDAPISSSRIRALIENGNVEQAAEMLGSPYSIALPVSEGRGDGRKLGFPTLNQFPPENRLVPKFGVYATRTHLPDGRKVLSVTDCGTAPTLDSRQMVRVETHMIDTSANLYGKTVKVEFLRYLRGEMVFPSVDALTRQVNEDIEAARAVFAENN